MPARAAYAAAEAEVRDARDLLLVVVVRVDRLALAVHDAALLRLAEVDAAGQLTDDDDVDALDHLGLERGGRGQSGIADGRTQIGKHFQIFAQAQQTGFGAGVIGRSVSGKAPYSAILDPGRQRSHATETRHPKIRCDVLQRKQNEIPLRNARVRDRQHLVVDPG